MDSRAANLSGVTVTWGDMRMNNSDANCTDADEIDAVAELTDGIARCAPRWIHGRRDDGDRRDEAAGCGHIAWWIIAIMVTIVKALNDDVSAHCTDVVRVKGTMTGDRRKRRGGGARASGKLAGRLPWAPRARWALSCRVVGRRRLRRRRGRVRGLVRAMQLGGYDDCGTNWRAWKCDRDGGGAAAEDARRRRWDAGVRDEGIEDGDHMVHLVDDRRGAGRGNGGARSRSAARVDTRRRPRRRRGGLVSRYIAIVMGLVHWCAGRGVEAVATSMPADGRPGSGGLVEACAKWRQVVEYPGPHKDGFRDVITPGHDEGAPGPGRRHPSEEFSLVVETVNATGWGPLSRRLEETHAQVVLGQETWILEGQMARVSEWCRRKGWEVIMAPAAVGPGGGASGGVAIFGRVGVGLMFPQEGSHILEEARAVAGIVHPPGHRPFTVVSVYLRDGRGVKEENKGTLAAVGQCAAAQGPNSLLVCGGDFQCSPDCIERSGFPSQVQGRIAAADTHRGTFRTRASASTLDYFVISRELGMAVDRVELAEGTGVKGHVPVQVTFRARPVALKGLAVRNPPKIPVERVFGPAPPPRDWAEVTEVVRKAHEVATRSNDVRRIQRHLDKAYECWSKLAEGEIADATGTDPAKWGVRASKPRLKWTSILPESVKAKAPSKTARITWLRGFANELGRIADLLVAEVGAGIFIDPAPSGTNRPHGATFATPVRGGYHGDRGRTAVDRCRGGRPRPATDLVQCAKVVDEIGVELGVGRGCADLDDDIRSKIDQVIGIVGRVRRALEQTRDTAAHDDCQLTDDVTVIADELLKEEKASEAEREAEGKRQWKAWLESDWASGARRAHAATRLPVEWRPAVVDIGGGRMSASPIDLLGSMRKKYVEYWDATDDAFEYEWRGKCRPLDRLTPELLRAASLAFPRRTTMTYDGFHVRHFALVSDEGLELLSIVLEIVEMVSRWPSQVGIVTTPMLPKPTGGHRLIGKLSGLYRLWAKARRPHAVAWEEAHDRPYFAATAGSGPVDAVFRQSMRQESSCANGEVAITMLEDMEAFYESICRDELTTEAAILGFPTCIVRASMATYAAPRFIAMGQHVARETYARRGIVAGCAFATTFAKIFYIRKFDRIIREIPPSTKLDVYIDDVATTTVGPRRRAVAEAIRVHDVIRKVLTRGLGCKLAAHKASVVASDAAAGKTVAAAVGRAGAAAESAANLGVDITAGGRRSRIGRKSKRSIREKAGIGRGRRLWAVSKAIGRKALRIFTAGVAPAMCHGAQIWGMADAEVQVFRRVASQAMRPRSRCRSLTAVNLVHDMPTSTWETAVVVEYARAVWRAHTQREHAADRGVALSDIRRQWELAHGRMEGVISTYRQSIAQGSGRANATVARRAWAEVKGPIGATALTLARLGWRMSSAFTLENSHGDEIALTTTSPAMVRHYLREATLDAAERIVAAQWAEGDPAFVNRRICPDVAVKLIRSACGGRLNAVQLGAYRAAVCGGIYTRQRAERDGYVVDNVCALCGAAGDTIHHRVFCCPCTKAAVLEQVPRWLYEEGGRARPTDRFWSTSVFPHPADEWPRPAASFDGVIVGDEAGASGAEQWYEPTVGFGGWVYTDGSCEHSPIRGLARAAAAAVQVNENGDRIRAVQMPVPRHLPQTSQAGEFVGVATARRMMVRRAHLRSDCENVVRMDNAPARVALSAAKVYAGIALDKYTRAGDPAIAGTVVSWVKSHRTETDDMSGEERRDVRGNTAADKLAGEAVMLHPQPSEELRQQLEFYLKRAPLIARAVGTALAIFPAAETQRLRRRTPAASAEEAAATERHFWQYGQGMWRCDRCGTWAHGDELRPRHHVEKCQGHVAHRRAEGWIRNGHKISMVSGVVPFAFCTRCGSWGSRRSRNLDKACRGPTPAGAMALVRIARGKHPWRKRLSGGGEAARSNVAVTATFDRATGRWSSHGSKKRAVARRGECRAASGDHDADAMDQRRRVRAQEGRHCASSSGTTEGGGGVGQGVSEHGATAAGDGGAPRHLIMMQVNDADFVDNSLGHGGSIVEDEPCVMDLWDEDPFGHGGGLDGEDMASCHGGEAGASGGVARSVGEGRIEGGGMTDSNEAPTSGARYVHNADVGSGSGRSSAMTGRERLDATRDRVLARLARGRKRTCGPGDDAGEGGVDWQLQGCGEPPSKAGLPQAQTQSIADGQPPRKWRCGSVPPRRACVQMHRPCEPARPGRGLWGLEPAQRPCGGDVDAQYVDEVLGERGAYEVAGQFSANGQCDTGRWSMGGALAEVGQVRAWVQTHRPREPALAGQGLRGSGSAQSRCEINGAAEHAVDVLPPGRGGDSEVDAHMPCSMSPRPRAERAAGDPAYLLQRDAGTRDSTWPHSRVGIADIGNIHRSSSPSRSSSIGPQGHRARGTSSTRQPLRGQHGAGRLHFTQGGDSTCRAYPPKARPLAAPWDEPSGEVAKLAGEPPPRFSPLLQALQEPRQHGAPGFSLSENRMRNNAMTVGNGYLVGGSRGGGDGACSGRDGDGAQGRDGGGHELGDEQALPRARAGGRGQDPHLCRRGQRPQRQHTVLHAAPHWDAEGPDVRAQPGRMGEDPPRSRRELVELLRRSAGEGAHHHHAHGSHHIHHQRDRHHRQEVLQRGDAGEHDDVRQRGQRQHHPLQHDLQEHQHHRRLCRPGRAASASAPGGNGEADTGGEDRDDLGARRPLHPQAADVRQCSQPGAPGIGVNDPCREDHDDELADGPRQGQAGPDLGVEHGDNRQAEAEGVVRGARGGQPPLLRPHTAGGLQQLRLEGRDISGGEGARGRTRVTGHEHFPHGALRGHPCRGDHDHELDDGPRQQKVKLELSVRHDDDGHHDHGQACAELRPPKRARRHRSREEWLSPPPRAALDEPGGAAGEHAHETVWNAEEREPMTRSQLILRLSQGTRRERIHAMHLDGAPPEGVQVKSSGDPGYRHSLSHQYGKHDSRGSSPVRSRAPGTVSSDTETGR